MTNESAHPGEPAAGAASAPSLPTAVDRLCGVTSDRKLIRLVRPRPSGDLAHLIYGADRGMKVSLKGFTHNWQLGHRRQGNGCTH